MRDAKEIARETFRHVNLGGLSARECVESAIATAQREAWDAAIKAAARMCDEITVRGTFNFSDHCAAAIRSIPYPEKP
jgi:hypothetical protein